jgi:hypothetical protein
MRVPALGGTLDAAASPHAQERKLMARQPGSFSVFVALVLAAGGASAQYSSGRTVRCESVNSREVACAIPDGKVAEFVEQNSRADCIRGRTYFIERDRIVVTQGCRATFRLADAPYGADNEELRSRLAVELGRMIRSDHRLSSTPSVTILTDDDHAEGNSQLGYEGTARVERSGKYWNTVEFDATYDLRSRAFTRIDYDIAGDEDTNERMDADAEAAIMRALADEVRRQKGGG